MIRQKIKFTEEMRLKRNSDLKDYQYRITNLKKMMLLILVKYKVMWTDVFFSVFYFSSQLYVSYYKNS